MNVKFSVIHQNSENREIQRSEMNLTQFQFAFGEFAEFFANEIASGKFKELYFEVSTGSVRIVAEYTPFDVSPEFDKLAEQVAGDLDQETETIQAIIDDLNRPDDEPENEPYEPSPHDGTYSEM